MDLVSCLRFTDTFFLLAFFSLDSMHNIFKSIFKNVNPCFGFCDYENEFKKSVLASSYFTGSDSQTEM